MIQGAAISLWEGGCRVGSISSSRIMGLEPRNWPGAARRAEYSSNSHLHSNGGNKEGLLRSKCTSSRTMGRQCISSSRASFSQAISSRAFIHLQRNSLASTYRESGSKMLSLSRYIHLILFLHFQLTPRTLLNQGINPLLTQHIQSKDSTLILIRGPPKVMCLCESIRCHQP